jgi:hypothetical protein
VRWTGAQAARGFIRAHGGAVGVPHWGKFWLATCVPRALRLLFSCVRSFGGEEQLVMLFLCGGGRGAASAAAAAVAALQVRAVRVGGHERDPAGALPAAVRVPAAPWPHVVRARATHTRAPVLVRVRDLRPPLPSPAGATAAWCTCPCPTCTAGGSRRR